MKTNNLFIQDGIEYGDIAPTLSMVPMYNQDGTVTYMISFRGSLYNEVEKTHLPSNYDRTLVVPNTTQCSDSDVQKFINSINTAIEELIISKNM